MLTMDTSLFRRQLILLGHTVPFVSFDGFPIIMTFKNFDKQVHKNKEFSSTMIESTE